MPRVSRITICRQSLATIAPVVLMCGALFILPTPVFSQCADARFGTASTFTTSPQPATNARAAPIAAGDFNSDGKVDLATASTTNTGTSGTVTTLLGDGTGRFGSPSETNLNSTQTVARIPHAIVAGDFNRDGNLDLATANNGSKNISVLLGDGTGRFSTERINVFPISGSPTSIAAGDFNNDGKLDLVTTNPFFVRGATVSVLFGDGTGTFSGSNGQPENIYPVSYDTPTSITVGDFNGDAQQDFAVVGSHQSTYPAVPTYVSIFMGNGRGSFAPVNEFRVVTNRDHTVAAVGPHGIAVADFNRDGKQDLVVGLSYMTFTYAGDGRGGFSLASMFENTLSRSISVGDFNGDTKLDIVRTGQWDTGIVSVTLGDGTGNFGAPLRFSVGEVSYDMVVSDFNGDGKHDLAGASGSGAKDIWVLLNTCTSSVPTLLTEANSSRAIALDSVTLMRDPFPLVTTHNFSFDGRTRITLFAANVNLSPGESSSIITAQAEDSQRRIYIVPVEYVGTVPGFGWLTQVVVKLPVELNSAGDLSVSINVRGAVSNKTLVNIR